LQQMVGTGGFIEQFVSLGGVAVINVAGELGSQLAVAPDGVGFDASTQHNDEAIDQSLHPYITGIGFGGEPLDPTDFHGWSPTDYGMLTNLPERANVLLENSDGPSWVEYQHGDGRVIVTTLTYYWLGKPNSDMAPARNLLRYSRFYSGSAYTPAPTVTATLSPTPTPTRTITPTPLRSATPTRTPSRTPSPTPVILPGDLNHDGLVNEDDLDDLIATIYLGTDPPDHDLNGDGVVNAADISALMQLIPVPTAAVDKRRAAPLAR